MSNTEKSHGPASLVEQIVSWFCADIYPYLFWWIALPKDLKKWMVENDCRTGKHDWELKKMKHGNLIYTTRLCNNCLVEEVQLNGGLGDLTWRDIKLPFKNEWEKKEFDKATVVSCRLK